MCGRIENCRFKHKNWIVLTFYLRRKLNITFSHFQTFCCPNYRWGFPGAASVKESACHPQETQVWSLGWEDPLEEEMATHSSILARRILWTEDLVGHSSWGHRELNLTEQLSRSSHSNKLQMKTVWEMFLGVCLWNTVASCSCAKLDPESLIIVKSGSVGGSH